MNRTPLPHLCGALVALLLLAPASAAAGAEPDLPLREGFVSKGEPRRGVVLSLHGCAVFPVIDWNNFFIRNGFKIFAPDSFAETRPGAACAYPYPQRLEILAIRRRQTAKSLAQLKQRFPDKPIYVWGHGEGATVALSLDLSVDGVVITGHHCALEDDRPIEVHAAVPLLVVQGDRVPDIDQTFHLVPFRTPREICESTLTSPQWRYVIVAGEGQPPRLNRAEARAALERFLNIPAPSK